MYSATFRDGCPWLTSKIPRELLDKEILGRLPLTDRLKSRRVCKIFRDVLENQSEQPTEERPASVLKWEHLRTLLSSTKCFERCRCGGNDSNCPLKERRVELIGKVSSSIVIQFPLSDVAALQDGLTMYPAFSIKISGIHVINEQCWDDDDFVEQFNESGARLDFALLPNLTWIESFGHSEPLLSWYRQRIRNENPDAEVRNPTENLGNSASKPTKSGSTTMREKPESVTKSGDDSSCGKVELCEDSTNGPIEKLRHKSDATKRNVSERKAPVKRDMNRCGITNIATTSKSQSIGNKQSTNEDTAQSSSRKGLVSLLCGRRGLEGPAVEGLSAFRHLQHLYVDYTNASIEAVAATIRQLPCLKLLFIGIVRYDCPKHATFFDALPPSVECMSVACYFDVKKFPVGRVCLNECVRKKSLKNVFLINLDLKQEEVDEVVKQVVNRDLCVTFVESGRSMHRVDKSDKGLVDKDRTMPIAKEEPYAYVIGNRFAKEYCSCCFQRAEKLLRCSKCKFVHFCGRKCQEKMWPDHKEECSDLARCSPKVPQELPRLICRILRKMDRTLVTETFPNGRSFTALVSHADDIKNDKNRSETFAELLKVVHEFMGDDSIDSNLILDVYGKLTSNGFSISNDDMSVNIGSGLYLNMSALDHSCDPNCVVVFDGPTACLGGLKDNAKKWDVNQLTIGYVELLASTEERQRQLHDQYYFTCSCPVCMDTQRNEQMQGVKCVKNDCDGFVSSTAGHPEILKLAKDMAQQLAAVLHPLNIHLYRVLDIAFDVCIHLQLWSEALQYGQMVLKFYEIYYPQYYPVTGIHLMKLGKIYYFLENLEDTDLCLQKAMSQLTVTHGMEHPLYKQVRELVGQCHEEKAIRLERKQKRDGVHIGIQPSVTVD